MPADRKKVASELLEIVADHTEINAAFVTFPGETKLSDLNIDSLTEVALVMDLEDHFELKLMDAAYGLETLDQYVDLIIAELDKNHG